MAAAAMGAVILFSWPSNTTLTGYAANREAATCARDRLAEPLTMLARDRRVDRITVPGYSMGG